MRRVPIGNVVTEPCVWNPREATSAQPFRYIDISSVDSTEKRITGAAAIVPFEAPSRARQLVRSGDVLVSTVRPNLNAVAIVPEELDGATASTGFAVLRPDPTKIEARYLYHWVRTAAFVRALTARATGASYPAVTENVVRESKLPLPPLAEQRRIAAVLDKADAIRRKRRESLRLLDEFLRSAFLEMFGDAVKNEKGWEVTRLEQVADIVSGVTKGRKLGDEHVAPVPYLRVANVQDGYLDLAEVKTIDATTREATQYRLQVGDILLTEGGDPDKLGRGAVWRGEVEACIHQNHVFRVRMSDGGFAPEYVSALLGSAYGKRYFLKAAKQTTGIASINRTQLGGFPVIRAPIGSQERYAAMVLGVRAVKERFGDATLSADHLFDSLAQRAFRGEL